MWYRSLVAHNGRPAPADPASQSKTDKMKLTIAIVAKHNTIRAAIEAIAHESDSIASGIIGPSFACSGPGSGWQQNFGVTDYAKRALDDAFGAASYIDSGDGREATMEDGEVVWSEESVVEIELPTVAECLESPEAWAEIRANGASYGMDAEELAELAVKVANPYRISDGNAKEYAATLEEVVSIVEDWYDYLVDEGKVESIPAADLPTDDLDSLTEAVRKWENEIAEAMGAESFAGHGRYFVSAADRAGLSLTIEIRD